MLLDPQTYCAASGNRVNRKQRNFLNHALTFQRLHEEWGMNLYIKLSTLLILEIGRLLFIFPYESLEMSGDEKPIGSIVRSHYMGSCYCLLWKLNDCVANYSRGFPVIFSFITSRYFSVVVYVGFLPWIKFSITKWCINIFFSESNGGFGQLRTKISDNNFEWRFYDSFTIFKF